MKPNEYKCAACKNIYERAVTDEEAQAEAVEIFGEFTPEDFDLICDDCFKRVDEKLPMASWSELHAEKNNAIWNGAEVTVVTSTWNGGTMS